MSDVLRLIEGSSEARRNGDHATAVTLAEEAAEMSRTSGDPHDLGAALAALGRLRRDERDHQRALALYEQAAELARKNDDQDSLAQRLRHIGDILTQMGELERAEQCYDEAGRIFQSLDIGQLGEANFLRSIALLKEKQGASVAAADLWVRARALYAATGIEAGVQESDRRLALLRPA